MIVFTSILMMVVVLAVTLFAPYVLALIANRFLMMVTSTVVFAILINGGQLVVEKFELWSFIDALIIGLSVSALIGTGIEWHKRHSD